MKAGQIYDPDYNSRPAITVIIGRLYEIKSGMIRSAMAPVFKDNYGVWHFLNNDTIPLERGDVVLPTEHTDGIFQVCLYGEGFVAVSKRDLQEVEV